MQDEDILEGRGEAGLWHREFLGVLRIFSLSCLYYKDNRVLKMHLLGSRIRIEIQNKFNCA